MRFMMLYKPGFDGGPPPTTKETEDMGRLIGEMAAAGILIATDGLLDSTTGTRVRIDNGKFTVTDGPFTETKELIAGYAMVQLDSKAEAIAWAKKFLELVGEGESEIRQMHDQAAYP